MIDWQGGYHATYRVYEVDEGTWADGAIVDGVTGIDITRESDGDSPLMESGSMSVDLPVDEGFRERYLRVAMVARQGGSVERVDVATMLFASTSDEVDRGFADTELTGVSVLYPASREDVEAGSYAPMGANGPEFVGSMLRGAIAAPVVVDGSFTLDEHVVFDQGAKVLDAAWMVLRAGNFVLMIDGDGTVHVTPMPEQPALSLDSVGISLLLPSIGRELDYTEVPNRFRAMDGSQYAEAVNDDPTSPTSTVTRGYVHDGDGIETSPIRVNGETLQAYCNRMLEERSTVHDTRTYRREWWPGVTPFSVVEGSVPSVGMDGTLRVEKQSLELGKGIVVSETAYREVKTWTAG